MRLMFQKYWSSSLACSSQHLCKNLFPFCNLLNLSFPEFKLPLFAIANESSFLKFHKLSSKLLLDDPVPCFEIRVSIPTGRTV